MHSELEKTILNTTGATQLTHLQDIQSLWSGYGKIVRFGLTGCEQSTVVVKHVKLPEVNNHPRGWNTDISHQRKIRSYQVESAWYQHGAKHCDSSCRVPQCFAVETTESEFFILLEDLDGAGFPVRKDSANLAEMQSCLKWLANFHATFLTTTTCQKDDQQQENQLSKQLWPIGTYWHLDTRPDELNALDDLELKNAAELINQKLNQCQYQTLVHGDAKLANFCFSENDHQVAAVDFQYVGGGCGMKDVAYFIGSCLFEEDCERLEKELLDIYFAELELALNNKNSPVDFEQLQTEWRAMYPIAWTDFHRFLKGWSPGHWKLHGYSERIAREVVTSLNLQKQNGNGI